MALINGVKRVNVKLHEIGKSGGKYKDDERKTGVVTKSGERFKCEFNLNENEIVINNLLNFPTFPKDGNA